MTLRKFVGVGLVVSGLGWTNLLPARSPYRPLLGGAGGPLDNCGLCAPAPAIQPCGVCAQPVQPIIQPLQQPVFQTQLRPVAETTYQERRVVSYQNVPETQHVRQTYVENVPVTTYQNVTVDEGGYQMVWVSKPVTKTVAQTVVQQQIKHQDVAVTVNRQVAQVHTELVPQQVVHYVPETRQVGMQYVGSRIVGWQAAGAPVMAGTFGTPFLAPIPMTAGLPTAILPGAAGVPADRLVPHPEAATNPGEWQTIPQRHSAAPVGVAPQAAAAPPAQVQQSQRQTDSVVR